MINFRLADALPLQFLKQLEQTVEKEDDPERRRRIEAYLDAGAMAVVFFAIPALADW